MPLLEKKRNEGVIGSSLDAKVFLRIEHLEARTLVEKFLKPIAPDDSELARVLIVSQVQLTKDKSIQMEEVLYSYSSPERHPVRIGVRIEKADGAKCVRCWNYSTAVGKDTAHPGLCAKCLDAIRSSGPA